MRPPGRILALTLVAATAVTVVIIVIKTRRAEATAVAAADDIEAEFGALSPVERAAVAAKLSADAVKDVKTRRRSH